MPSLVSILVTSVLTLLYFIIGEGISDIRFLLVTLLNTCICTFFMFANVNRPFTLQKMINLFIFVFFILANGVQYARDTITLTFRMHFSSLDYFIFQVIVAIILLIYNFTYIYFFKKQKTRRVFIPIKKRPVKIYSSRLLVLALLATILVVIHYRAHLFDLFMRGTVESLRLLKKTSSDGNASALIFDKILRPLPFAALLLSLIGNTPRYIRYILCALTLVTCSPTGLSRNATAMIWIPILLLAFRKHLKKNRFMWSMVFALFVVFPFFNVFRIWNGRIDFHWSMDFVNNINFDASQVFMAELKTDFVTYGYQLLGALFFFVPRSIWPSKPIGSGAWLVDSMHGHFNNISMPFFAEGYVNFGYPGLLLFVLFCAWLSAKLDFAYWSKWCKTINTSAGYYLIMIGAIVFIMRGDLMSSFAYTVGIMISYAICLLLGTNTKIQIAGTRKHY